ncbi:MAG TPA: hypothetical protein VEJ23_10085 [Solirubrobacteraceae bacterium]|nr:hypothetical protein [Solirubrobacteraceae bacterium]
MGGCAAAYGIALVVNFHEVIASVYVDSDAAVGPVLAQAIGHAPAGSYVSLGNHAWYEEWLFLLATRGAPGHRQLWQIAPALVSLAGLALFVVAAWRVWGGRYALLSGAALLCVGAFGRFCFLSFGWHSFAFTHMIILVAASLWFLDHAERISLRGLVIVSVCLGAACALPTASDGLFPFWALGPLIARSAAAAWHAPSRLRARLAAFVVIVLVASVVGAVAIAGAMRAGGVTARALPITLATPGRIGHNIELLAESYAYLAGGRLTAPRLDAQGILVPATALLVLLALSAGLVRLARVSLGRVAPPARLSTPQVFYVAFWASSLIATSLVFIGTTAPRNALSGRYLLGAYAAIAALLPLIALQGERARRAVMIGVCALALVTTYQLIRRPFEVIHPPDEALRFPGLTTAAALASFAREQRVSYGYGGYWDAEALTWETGFKVLIRPVRVCSASASFALCYPQIGMISSWYAPKPHTRSLLIVDEVGVSFNGVLGRDRALGRPRAMRRLDGITAYVYPYDIASRLALPHCHFSWAHP